MRETGAEVPDRVEGEPAAASAPVRGLEEDTIVRAQVQRIGQAVDRVPIGCTAHAPLQVADRPCAQAGSIGQLLLREAGCQAVLPEQRREGWWLDQRHRLCLP